NRGGWYVRKKRSKPTDDAAGETARSTEEPPPASNDVREETLHPDNEKHYRFKLVPFSGMRPGVEQPYLVGRIIPATAHVDIWGKVKYIKSFWTLDLMLHVSMGWEYRDRRVRQGTVVYCAFEGGHGYKKRIEAQRRHYKIVDDANVPLFVMSGQASLV